MNSCTLGELAPVKKTGCHCYLFLHGAYGKLLYYIKLSSLHHCVAGMSMPGRVMDPKSIYFIPLHPATLTHCSKQITPGQSKWMISSHMPPATIPTGLDIIPHEQHTRVKSGPQMHFFR